MKKLTGNPRTAAAKPVYRLLNWLERRRRVDFHSRVDHFFGFCNGWFCGFGFGHNWESCKVFMREECRLLTAKYIGKHHWEDEYWKINKGIRWHSNESWWLFMSDGDQVKGKVNSFTFSTHGLTGVCELVQLLCELV